MGVLLFFLNDALGKVLQTKGDFEQHFLQIFGQIVRPGDLCIDLGAYLGYHSVTQPDLTARRESSWPWSLQRIIFQQL